MQTSSSPELPPSSPKDISMHVAMDIEVEISGDAKTNDALDSTADIQNESILAPPSDKETISFFPDQGTNKTTMKWYTNDTLARLLSL